MKKNQPKVGHKPGVEVQDYLNFLLQEATSPFEASVEEPVPEVERVSTKTSLKQTSTAVKAPDSEYQQQARQIAARATPVAKPVLERPRLLPQIAQPALTVAKAAPVIEEPVVKEQVKTQVAAEPAQQVEVQTEEQVQPSSPETVEFSPLAESFQCLLFDVGSLKLAVPLVELGSICQLLEPLTPLFGQPDWYLGISTVQGRNIKVVDTGHWVLQDRYQPEIKEQYQFLLTFPDVDWGLAVTSLHEAVLIQQSEVAWRAVRDTSPWMAGVVRKHMCALLDMQQFELCFSHTQ